MTPALRLVFADDDPATRELVRTLLGLVDAVDVVAEAADGEEALRLVQEHEPDVVLLDVEMPRLDGPTAAELIHALRPQTRVVLHTAQPQDDVRRRADRLGVPLLDRMRFDEIVAALGDGDGAGDPAAAASLRLEAAIVSALAVRGGDAAVVVRPDGTVPFYNERAADLLGLPTPMRPSTIDEVREHYEVHDRDGAPLPAEQRPIARAARERAPLTELLVVARGDVHVRVETTVVPFVTGMGAYVGAVVFFRRL